MINIAVAAQRVFTFPADAAASVAYFRDFERTVRYLPHLSLVKTYARDQYRIAYTSGEGSIYRVAFYCDIQVRFDEAQRALHITPLPGVTPVAPKATFSTLTGQGYYSSTTVFAPAGARTRVNYEVEIRAGVPKRLELRLVPDGTVKRIVEGIVRQRLQEITDAFIARSIAAFPG